MKSEIWNIRKKETFNQNSNNKQELKKKKKTQPIRTKRKEKRIQKNEDSVISLWDNFKHSNICIIRVPEKMRKSKKLKIYLEK